MRDAASFDEFYRSASRRVLRLVSVVRVGNVVTVLYEQGWEGTSSDRGVVDDYTQRAVAAIRAWLERSLSRVGRPAAPPALRVRRPVRYC